MGKKRRLKMRLKTSFRVRELEDKYYEKNAELVKLTENYNRYKNNPESDLFKKAIRDFQKNPALRDELKALWQEIYEEKFNAHMGEDYDNVLN